MTTTPSSSSTFTQRESVDKPGIIGAQWWQDSIATQVPRRKVIHSLLVLGGVLGAMTAMGTCVAVIATGTGPSTPSADDVTFQPRAALEMQKEYGWNFGATDEALVFDGQSAKPFDRTALDHMADDLAPSETRDTPFFVGTLFQSPAALQKSTPSGDSAATFAPLKTVLVPISTPAMDIAFKQGQALAALLAKEPRAKDLAVIVDLPGPEAVAFAAGASNVALTAGATTVLDPIFLFDNWPHPRGVVPAHLTLAAAAYYQPMFALARAARKKGSSRPMFVLDRKRLATYTDEASQFDNRHTARMPSASAMATLGVKNVLYVGPNAIERQESDDLVDDLLAYTAAKIQIHTVPATAFEPDVTATTADTYFYGGTAAKSATFWTDWNAPPSTLSTNEVKSYVPVARTTPFSSGTASSSTSRPRPTNFGMIPVAIAVGTGVILGARLNRSGSWNRTTSSSSGELTMSSTIFSIEVAARLDRAPNLLPLLKSAITEQTQTVGLNQKWQLYKRATEALLGNLGLIERGCWDYFDDHQRAEKDFQMWLGGMTTEEGSRTQPSGKPDPYRGEPRYLTFTMTFLMEGSSPTDRAVAAMCNIPQPHLWRRDVFGRILAGMSIINFASVKSDVMYLIPRDDDWGLTVDDLMLEKFHYLRVLE